MTQFRKNLYYVSIIAFMLLWGGVTSLYAQDQPRPTPTYDPTINTSTSDSEHQHGTIQGFVYEDVNGDGRCINTGVAGEGPVAGVDIQFVSSDEQTVITLQSGPDGRYGLAAAGFSYWGVTAKPSSDWVVTSEQTLYAPVFADSRAATGINFCVQQAKTATVLLPASGGAGLTPILSWLLLGGLVLFGVGAGLQWRQKSL